MAKNALLIPEKPDKSDKDLQCFSYKREGSSEENITVKMMKDKIYIETTQYVNADSYEEAIGSLNQLVIQCLEYALQHLCEENLEEAELCSDEEPP